MKVGRDTVPCKAIASRTRSKSFKQGFTQEQSKCQIDTPVVDVEYLEFLNSLLTSKDVPLSSNKDVSTSSSSGSSVIRMLQDSPDSPDTVIPGSSSSSSIVVKDEPTPTQDSSQSCILVDSSSSSGSNTGNVIQPLPGFTTVIKSRCTGV